MEFGRKTALHFAAAFGHTDLVRSLALLPSCNTTARDASLQTPLHVAIRSQRRSAAQVLREHPSGDAAARMRDIEGRLPDSLAPTAAARAKAEECQLVFDQLKGVARHGGESVLRNLLENDDPHFVLGWKDEVSRGLIHYASCHGRPELCRLALDPRYSSASAVRESAAQKDGRGFTPLHYAASWGHTSTMAVLLDAVADDGAAAARIVAASDTAGGAPLTPAQAS